jgi:hypothetical protein
MKAKVLNTRITKLTHKSPLHVFVLLACSRVCEDVLPACLFSLIGKLKQKSSSRDVHRDHAILASLSLSYMNQVAVKVEVFYFEAE